MTVVRSGLVLLAFCALSGGGLFAQQPALVPPRDESILGARFATVPDHLYAHIPSLKRGDGLLVQAIRPGSQAAQIGLKRFDIVVAVGAIPVKNTDELQSKLGTLQAGERDVLQIIRGGKQFALTVANPVASSEAATYMPPKSLFKPGGPPAVSVEVKPIPAGGMEVNLFYLNQTNKVERHALHGSLEEIERQVTELARAGQMPENIQDLVSLALLDARVGAHARA